MDHETMILAAIAIGKNYPFIQKDQGGRVWEPHLDDGDALRLAVKLGIDIAKAQVDYWDKDSTDPYAATRRAIVRAAAAIVESMFTENRQTEDGCPIDPQQSVVVMFDDGSLDGGMSRGINAGAWHESWNTSRQTHIKAYWVVNDE